MHVKNVRKNNTKEADFQKATAAIYRSLLVRLRAEEKKRNNIAASNKV